MSQTSSTVRLRATLNLCTCLAPFTTYVAFAMALSGCAVAPVEPAMERLEAFTRFVREERKIARQTVKESGQEPR